MGPAVSAYVPCFNNAATLRRAVESVFAQSRPPAEVIVVDDGSSDRSYEQVRDLSVRLVRHERNLGRGAARARAMREARHGVVLCCDATNVLERDFTAKALPWFDAPEIAAVFGRIAQPPARGVADRWRGRHLFKLAAQLPVVRHHASLMTAGTLLRKSAVAAAGGYDATLRHSEDVDLGQRLLACGYDIVCDPRLAMVSIATNTVAQVLERYWRWYAGAQEKVTWRGYWKNIGYSVKAMAAADLRAGDPLAAAVSLGCPHYQFWRSWWRRRRIGNDRE